MQQLPFETWSQFAALALTLITGWFFGLASHPGGRKWKELYQEEELSNASYRHQAEMDLKDANRRIRELEAERDRLASGAAAAPVVAAEAAEPGAGWRGWFGWGRDNLSRIRGIDEARERRLNELGIKTYREIETMTAEDEAALEQRMGLDSGTIAREEWREQAAMLRAGNEDEHARRFAPAPVEPVPEPAPQP